MLELILEFFMELIAEALTILFGLFNKIMEFRVDAFPSIFPTASRFYAMFQAIGIGLVMTIAIYNMFKFFAGPLTKTTERPTTILVRTFFAIGLIYFGNYILNIVFDATASIYNAFVETGNLDVISNTLSNSASFGGELVSIGIAATAGSSVIMLFMIILCISLVIQFTKMMLEILERFITLNLLIYSSPLAWATFASESSSTILKKWVSMFIGQSILMILSAWGVALFLAVLQNQNPEYPLIVRMLYGFALVKIIKRFDNYLQQVGLNAAGIGGGSILDSIATTSGMLGIAHGHGGGGGSRSSILGGNMFNRLVQTSPLAQGILGAGGAIANAKASGSGGIKAAVKGFGKGWVGGTNVGGAVQRAHAVKSAGGTAGQQVGAMVSGRKNNPLNVQQAASAQKATQAVRTYAANLKAAQNSKQTGVAAANALRSVSAMPAEAAKRPEVKTLLGQIGETLRDDPKAAFEAMDKIAKEGGLELSGDIASAAMEGFVGGEAFREAFGVTGEDTPMNMKDQTLTIGTNENGGHTFDYSGTMENPDGSLTSVQWSNMNGAVAEEYSAQESAYHKKEMESWKSAHPGAKENNGQLSYTYNEGGAEKSEVYHRSQQDLERWKSSHAGAKEVNGQLTYSYTDKESGKTRTEIHTAPKAFKSSNIKVKSSEHVANINNGSEHSQATYVKRSTPSVNTGKPQGKPGKK